MDSLNDDNKLVSVQRANWASVVQDQMYQMFRAEQLVDIFLTTSDGTRIGAHKTILGASSVYFFTAFNDTLSKPLPTTTPMTASQSATTTASPPLPTELQLIDVDGKVLKLLVNFCYTGGLDLSFDTIRNVIKVAIDLKFQTIIELCCEFLQQSLNIENCCFIDTIADHFNLTTLATIVQQFVLNNFYLVSHSEGFLQMDTDKLGRYLQSDELVVPMEETVFNALMRWTLHSSFKRLSYVPALLKMVRLTELDEMFLFDEVQNFAMGNNCSHLLIDALNWKFIPSRRDQINTKFQTQPRKFKMGLLAMAGTGNVGNGIGDGAGNAYVAGSTNKCGAGCEGNSSCDNGGNNDMTVERYSLATNEWMKVQYDDAKFPEGCAVVELNGEIIVLGGCQHKNRSISDVFQFNFDSSAPQKMAALPNMLMARAYHSAVTLNGHIYVAGGRNGSNVSSDLERFDSFTRQWYYLASMSNSRFDFNLALVKGRLFAIGGTATANKDRPNESFDSVECYEPITNQWTFVASMIKRRSQAACAVANGRLYVFGGYDNDLGVNAATDTVEYYDPERNTWTLVASLSSRRYSLCAVAIEEYIVVVGGKQTFRPRINSVDKYDVKNNSWSTLGALNYPRECFNLCLIKH